MKNTNFKIYSALHFLCYGFIKMDNLRYPVIKDLNFFLNIFTSCRSLFLVFATFASKILN